MTTALYRRYRPETFGEVIGQEHVTIPLMQALKNGRINHAYLFSGPRGCGKTTSARILARCLNCAAGPTDVPCGVCPSCVELARGGPGSLDVVEIDAASHGGVDDARDLRERATFAPVRDRYKIFILDEAHMVTPQGFNALLKIVEEPPEHVMFVFATTEPDKVIGTIRSRTHHYPFRLVPPDTLSAYLEGLCAAEEVPVGSGVLPLVIRAGAGSVRDSLSVLDQLVAGADERGLDYERAVELLGYTHSALLDDTVEAIAANDGASAFRVVERVITTGHEPRRFVEDLLERLRDLIVLAASGDAAEAALRDVPGDQLVRMRAQAAHLGPAELSRAADLVNAALGEMTGATSPRLHLELLVARLLLPAADDALLGHAARLDRLERGAGAGAGVVGTGAAGPGGPVAVPPLALPDPATSPPAAPPPVTQRPVADVVRQPEATVDVLPEPVPRRTTADAAPADVDAVPRTPAQRREQPVPAPVEAAAPTPATRVPSSAAPSAVSPAPAAPPAAPARPPGASPTPAGPPAPGAAGLETEVLRRRWPEVLETLSRLRKVTWVMVSQNAQVGELAGTTLTLLFPGPGLATAFRAGSHADVVQRAVRETLGFDVKIEGRVGDGAGSPADAATGGASGSGAGRPVAGRPLTDQPVTDQPVTDRPVTDRPGSDRVGTDRPGADQPGADRTGTARTRLPPAGVIDRATAEASWATVEPPDDDIPEGPTVDVVPPDLESPAPLGRPSARAAGERAHAAATRRAPGSAPPVEDSPSPDDPDLASSHLTGPPLVAQMLGGTVIDEQTGDDL